MIESSGRSAKSPHDIATRLVQARREGVALTTYPGPAPTTLKSGYEIQESAIALWDDAIAGWKIGLVAEPLRASLGAARVAGPVFSRSVIEASGVAGDVDFPVYSGGFAAVEAELLFRIAADAPAEKRDWSEDEAVALVGSLHIGVETAGSPMPMINELGPTVVASDFGNNFGVIVGPSIPDWRAKLDGISVRTLIDGVEVGRGGATSLPGGPMAGLCFLLEHLATRGRQLRKGELVSSGALTGVHDIVAGQSAEIDFGSHGVVHCRAAALHT